MNKKQAVIILTLLALIVCAGVYAAKINGDNLYVNGGDTTENGSALKKDEKGATTSSFAQDKVTRDLNNTEAFTRLKSIIDDKNAAAATKAEALTKYQTLTTALQQSQNIEAQLKLKSLDVICNIDNNTVNLVIKNKETKLTDAQKKDIEYVVLSVSKIKNIKYDIKQ